MNNDGKRRLDVHLGRPQEGGAPVEEEVPTMQEPTGWWTAGSGYRGGCRVPGGFKAHTTTNVVAKAGGPDSGVSLLQK